MMLVMPSNNGSLHVGYLAGRFPGRVGHLYSPGFQRGPYPFLPWALDNGRFAACSQHRPWDRDRFIALLEWAIGKQPPPRWVVVPDVVGDRDATLREWQKWAPHLERYGWPLAMAVQDGMTPADVPARVVCFLGGSTKWKRGNLWKFCAACARVHVGGINTERWLWECGQAGAESCDGTGWYREGDANKPRPRRRGQLAGLVRYLDRSSRGLGPEQGLLI